MRTKNAIYNLITSIISQLINFIVGIIVPRLIIETYGSSVNGLVSSITQFLGYIIIAEAGIGPVIQSIYYKAIANKDNEHLNTVLKTTERFFRKILIVFVAYIAILMLVYPTFVSSEFSSIFTISLIAIISISTIMQYFIGTSRELLIESDQKKYIVNISRTVLYVANAITIVILIKLDFSIHILKLASALIYTLSPLIFCMYVNRRYCIDKNAKEDKDILRDSWNGLAQHIANFIHCNIGVTILTIFSSLKEVSVYAVYLVIMTGLKNIIGTLTTSVSAAFGNMIANGENIKKKYITFDYLNMLITFIIFTIAGVTILPFVSVYTKNVTDVNYIRPIFAIIIILAEGLYSIKSSYTMIAYAAGHFKETKNDSWIETAIMIVTSILLVKPFGIIGVAIALLAATVYMTIVYIIYLSKNIVCWDIKNILKKYAVNIITVGVLGIVFSKLPTYSVNGYIDWIIYAIFVSVIIFATYLVANFLACKSDIKDVYEIYIKNILGRIHIGKSK